MTINVSKVLVGVHDNFTESFLQFSTPLPEQSGRNSQRVGGVNVILEHYCMALWHCL